MCLLVSKEMIKNEFKTVVGIPANCFIPVINNCPCFAYSKDINGNKTRYYEYTSPIKGRIVLAYGINHWSTIKPNLPRIVNLDISSRDVYMQTNNNKEIYTIFKLHLNIYLREVL